MMNRRHHKTFWVFLSLGITALSLIWAPAALGEGDWSPTPAPVIGDDIQVGGGFAYSDNSTVTVVEGDTVDLKTLASDNDTLTVSCSPSQVPDTANVLWTTDGGALSEGASRVASGATITFTAPNVPAGQTTITVTVQAQADDNTTQAPGNRPDGDSGNRDDNPGPTIHIKFKVIKNCPTNIGMSDSCTIGPSTWFAAGYKTGGFLTSKMCVSGGNPPTPPGNWNSLFIKESVALHPTNPGTGADGDFEKTGYRADSCSPTVQGFVVGVSEGGVGIGNCPRAQANDCFWDDHRRTPDDKSLVVLKDGVADKTVICQQKYYCKTTQLNTGATNNTFLITNTFHNSTYDPDGGGPLPSYRVTEVTISKAAD